MKTFLVMCLIISTYHVQAGWGKRDRAFSKYSVSVNGKHRKYLIHASKRVKNKRPLVMVFHGGYEKARKVTNNTGFNDLADREGFIVVYPVGIKRHWNDGRGTTNPRVDDVSFVRQMIRQIKTKYAIDERRIYATGASNGGLFTQRLACEMADQIAAFASVIASMATPVNRTCKPRRAVPILMINGTKDKIMPWRGGKMKGKGGMIMQLDDLAKFWARHNRCNLRLHKRQALPDIDKKDDSTVTKQQYTGCRSNANVVLYRVNGGGHSWPGGRNKQMKFLLGNVNQDIKATEIIWSFLKTHHL